MDAVSKLARDETSILAGHSLGGIEAQNVVRTLAERDGFNIVPAPGGIYSTLRWMVTSRIS
jgi:hypothetical protein